MTREEEHQVAMDFVRSGEAHLAERLVTANLRLVVKLARNYRRPRHNFLDLIQEGNVGLIVAVQKYDPTRGVKLSTFAAWWIRAYILKFILDNWRMLKVATTQAQRKIFFNLDKERQKLERDGSIAESKHLAGALDVSEQQVSEMALRMAPLRSLDAPLGGGEPDSHTQGELLQAASEDRPDARAEQGEFLTVLRDRLTAFSSTLTDRDLELFRLRLLTDEPAKPMDIARRFGISRQRVGQLEERIRGRVREFLTSEFGDALVTCRPV